MYPSSCTSSPGCNTRRDVLLSLCSSSSSSSSSSGGGGSSSSSGSSSSGGGVAIAVVSAAQQQPPPPAAAAATTAAATAKVNVQQCTLHCIVLSAMVCHDVLRVLPWRWPLHCVQCMAQAYYNQAAHTCM